MNKINKVPSQPLTQGAPLFMWAGGKRRLLKSYMPLLEKAGRFSSYVEPFAGGAALFDHLQTARLQNQDEPIKSVLGDTNAELMGLFEAVKTQPKELLDAISPYEAAWADQDKSARKVLFYQLRQKYWDAPRSTSTEKLQATALLYFLMKTAFNGIWQTCKGSNGLFGTPAGLLNQKGPVISAETVYRWSRMLSHTVLHVGTYQRIPIQNGAFIYCDPPYRDSFTNYSSGWNDDDLVSLIEWCRQQARDKKSLVWLANRLTEPDDGFFDRWAADATCLVIPVIYTAGRRKLTEDGHEAKPAKEVLLCWDGRPCQ